MRDILKALRVAGGSACYARSRGRMERNRRSKLLGASRRLAKAKSSMLHAGEQPGRTPHACTYVHPYFLFLIPGMYERESIARHSIAKTMKMNMEIWKIK